MSLSKQWHGCDRCGKTLSTYHSLWRHKKICQSSSYESIEIPEKYDDAGSVVSFNTINKIVNNKPSSINEKHPSIDEKRSVNEKHSGNAMKRSMDDSAIDESNAMSSYDSRPNILECMPHMVPAKKQKLDEDESDDGDEDESDESGDEHESDHDDSYYDMSNQVKEEPEEETENEKIERELDADDIDIVLPAFIDKMIKIPEIRLLELLEDLKVKNNEDENVLELERVFTH